MAADRLETFGGSLLQHGPGSDRVYLMKLVEDDLPGLLEHIDGLVKRHAYGKIFAKVPAGAAGMFFDHGYHAEAAVPRFFNGREKCLFMARYHRSERRHDPYAAKVVEVLDASIGRAARTGHHRLSPALRCRLASVQDCPGMATLYRRIFASYPFPIDQPEYLRDTMANDVLYAGIWQEQKVVALASAEIDRGHANAEMTDFATDPGFRRQGLAGMLLQTLEQRMQQQGIATCYTIARATSYGMNITFAARDYLFAGTLTNNTQIAGALESMNVWYKHLTD